MSLFDFLRRGGAPIIQPVPSPELEDKLETLLCAQGKVCRSCNMLKSMDDFYFQNKRTGSRQSYCKVCTATKARESARKAAIGDNLPPAEPFDILDPTIGEDKWYNKAVQDTFLTAPEPLRESVVSIPKLQEFLEGNTEEATIHVSTGTTNTYVSVLSQVKGVKRLPSKQDPIDNRDQELQDILDDLDILTQRVARLQAQRNG